MECNSRDRKKNPQNQRTEEAEANPQWAELKSLEASQSESPFTISSLRGFPRIHSSENLMDSQALFPAETSVLYLLNYFTDQSVCSYFSYLYFSPAGSTSHNKLLIINRVHDLHGHTIPMLSQICPVFLSCHICTRPFVPDQPGLEDSISPTHTVGSRSAPFQCHSFFKCAFPAVATHMVITCRERQNKLLYYSKTTLNV